ncbi:MAG TPA: winged helix-turn-helix domain-containing protein [Paraburkholderia sp.]|uniref:winged helix-turn-helix domain-containing protein n=1 Tax=Paraburkholderia sp. TaxID=1926495 RepID=UPI002B48E7C9|nr:winged helix-turn-helix domain-containing protein [Paraburkholderia sp.]HKR44549.1 winged helix-turn-helix domain-containing protein [Paraburkholderia sp.]
MQNRRAILFSDDIEAHWIANMGENSRFRGPPWTDRRVIAAEMLDRGQSIQQVAASLGLGPATARRYDALFKAGGKQSLLRVRDVGRRSQLQADGLNWLIAAIKHKPVLHGFSGDCWTRAAVVELIQREFGIQYSRSHINRLIRDYGLQGYFG